MVGCKLLAAMSSRTIAQLLARNIEDVPEIIRWFLAEPERARIWRYLSSQPEADTGRALRLQGNL
jgi:hypothetical protein